MVPPLRLPATLALTQVGQLAELLVVLGHLQDAALLQQRLATLGQQQQAAAADILAHPPPALALVLPRQQMQALAAAAGPVAAAAAATARDCTGAPSLLLHRPCASAPFVYTLP